MADHPEGLDLSREQALLVVCSTQVCALLWDLHVWSFSTWLTDAAEVRIPIPIAALSTLSLTSAEIECFSLMTVLRVVQQKFPFLSGRWRAASRGARVLRLAGRRRAGQRCSDGHALLRVRPG